MPSEFLIVTPPQEYCLKGKSTNTVSEISIENINKKNHNFLAKFRRKNYEIWKIGHIS